MLALFELGNLTNQLHTPVSYTHLDVYKRQIYASASDLAGNISAVLEQGEGTVTVTCGEQSAELPVKTVNGADYVPVRAFFEGIGYARCV